MRLLDNIRGGNGGGVTSLEGDAILTVGGRVKSTAKVGDTAALRLALLGTTAPGPAAWFAAGTTTGIAFVNGAAVPAGLGGLSAVDVRGTGTDGLGYVSNAVNVAVAAALAAPVNTVLPSISGALIVGETLTGNIGTWTGDPAPTFTYAWRRDGVAIAGATSLNYVTDTAGVHTFRATATNSEGAVTAMSAGVTVASVGVDRFDYAMSGNPTTDSARVTVSTTESASTRVAYWTQPDQSDVAFTPAQITDATVLAKVFDLTGMTADTTYNYQAEIAGSRNGPVQTVKTMPAAGQPFKFAFASCGEAVCQRSRQTCGGRPLAAHDRGKGRCRAGYPAAPATQAPASIAQGLAVAGRWPEGSALHSVV
jgi:uncharacterized ParB-like nuclease family protein